MVKPATPVPASDGAPSGDDAEVRYGFCCNEDELLDELSATTHQVGRLFSCRHGHGHGHGEVGEGSTDLSGPKLVALYVLQGHGPLRQSDLAMHLGVKAPAVSSLVDGLVESGYAERDADPDDRRATQVALTELGRVRLVEEEQSRRELMRRYCSVLSEDDIKNMIRINRKLIESMTEGRI